MEKAVKSGALFRYEVELERGEQYVRRLWLRPTVRAELLAGKLGDDQLARVHAALRRFVIGGQYNVVSKDCAVPSAVQQLGDIRELKGDPPPFFEMRFKPPKHHLRLFGRFVCTDGLILTSIGLKSEPGANGSKSLSVPEQRKRCDDFFGGQKFDLKWVPPSVEESISNAKII